MTSAWRIVRASRARTAFTGEGPWLYGARWNSPGVRVVYVSAHQSTAALEIFVQRVPFIVEEQYKAFYLEWPDNLIEIFPVKELPANWRISPSRASSAAKKPASISTNCARSGPRSARSLSRRKFFLLQIVDRLN